MQAHTPIHRGRRKLVRNVLVPGAGSVSLLCCIWASPEFSAGLLPGVVAFAVVVASTWIVSSEVRAGVAPPEDASSTSRATTENAGSHGNQPIDERGDVAGDLLPRLLPEWADNLELARKETEEAVVDLSARFGRLHEDLRFGLQEGEGQGSVLEGIQEARTELPRALALLQKTGEVRSRSLARLAELEGRMGDLKAMSEVVGKIASQTNLLALNAAIEAARSGEAGRGFSVVASEIRELSKSSAKTGKEIRSAVEVIVSSVSTALSEAKTSSEEEIRLIDGIEGRIEATLATLGTQVAAIEQRNTGLREVGSRTADTIGGVLVDLQFQDRTSQILGCVMDDLQRLTGVLGIGEPLDPDAWIAQLRSSYTTPEQASIGASVHESAGESVTFF